MRTRVTLFFSLSMLCAVVFLLTSWIWVYYINLIIGVPSGLMAFWLWRKTAGQMQSAARMIPVWLLYAGTAIGFFSLLAYR